MSSQKGFSIIFILLGVVVVMGFAGGVYYFGKSQLSIPQSPNQMIVTKTPEPTQIKTSAGSANPAAVNCEQKGGKSEIKTAPSGDQYGVCKFSDGTECEAWAYMNGTCKPGQYKNWDENINKQPNLSINFYTTGFTDSITDQSSENSWTKNTWTDKEKAKYLFLGITVHNTSSFSSTNKETALKIEGDINKEITIPVLDPGKYSQQIPIYIPLPPKNNMLRISVNSDNSVTESDYYDDYVFVDLKEGTEMTERASFDKTFDFEKQIATQLTCEDLKLINRINDFPNCSH